jgi:hypothetical protein
MGNESQDRNPADRAQPKSHIIIRGNGNVSGIPIWRTLL